ncbi:hypothetical protein GCM10012275_45560 [Longimycelium tulufanense]|uniref:Uncharacterized protein n=1 Tax=Longimycelium tulufanense TaxID=907463 RepID=A0A8J3FXP6_9PSEU|nr:hypothetical protein GCM10012275_45560 [Longimycelium tulufanense]
MFRDTSGQRDTSRGPKAPSCGGMAGESGADPARPPSRVRAATAPFARMRSQAEPIDRSRSAWQWSEPPPRSVGCPSIVARFQGRSDTFWRTFRMRSQASPPWSRTGSTPIDVMRGRPRSRPSDMGP